MVKILGMGNALVDIMTRIDHDEFLDKFSLPKGSMQLVEEEFIERLLSSITHFEQKRTSGGSAANTIHGLAKLGIETGYVGKVCEDEQGEFFLQDLKVNNIDPILFKGKAKSGIAMAFVSPDGDRTFATHLGSAMELSADDLSSDQFSGYDYFHIEGYLVQNHSLITRAVQLAKKNNLLVSLDLASYNVVEENLDFLKNLIKNYVNIVFANEEEAASFTGMEPRQALDEISKICDIAIVKTGRTGSMIKKAEEVIQIGIIPATRLDSTGAGDLYASGFLYGLMNNMSLTRSGELGALLSGKIIEVIGAKIQDETWKEIKQIVDKNLDITFE